MVKPDQFTLRNLFGATATVAAACWMTTVKTDESAVGLLAMAAVPILFCGAVGQLIGKLWGWLLTGVAFDLAIAGGYVLTQPAQNDDLGLSAPTSRNEVNWD